MERSAAEAFAREWVEAWNAHDLAAILAHYAEDIVFHSPRIASVLRTPKPAINGKAELTEYWSRALALAPELNFELGSVLVGSDGLTILYRNHRSEEVAETLLFDVEGKLVIRGFAAYS